MKGKISVDNSFINRRVDSSTVKRKYYRKTELMYDVNIIDDDQKLIE